MKPAFYLSLIIFTLPLCTINEVSAQKSHSHIYALSNKELSQMAEDAREPELEAFVVYNNGDTLKGKVLKRKKIIFNGHNNWQLDGKNIPVTNVTSYQDDESYNTSSGNYVRVYRGRINIFMTQEDDTKLTTSYNPTTQRFETHKTGSVTTTFFMAKGDKFVATNYNTVKEMVSDYAPALAAFNEEFPPNKKHKYMGKDYRAFARILKVYDDR